MTLIAPAEQALADVVRQALDTVLDPELDEPITDLGFVTSVAVDGGAVEIHLRLPTSFCSPNFAYLMASDAKAAVSALDRVTSVQVLLDDHHDTDKINHGLATDAGYRGTFGAEADDSLDELRLVFRRKAHTAAMERALTELLRAGRGFTEAAVHEVTLADLVPGRTTDILLRRRADLQIASDPDSPVLVDDSGVAYPASEAPLRFRMARSVRISVDGNAHFCRGLLATRYPGSDADQAPRVHGAAPDKPFISLTVLTEKANAS